MSLRKLFPDSRPLTLGETVADVAMAVNLLHRGELVAFPTETVYGLGADAGNLSAVNRIFQVKGRPTNHPLIVHICAAEQLSDWARDIPAAAKRLAERFWPGSLTLILKRAPHVLDVVTGGQDTIGLRVPNHPLALSLLNAFGRGLAAPSANRFGRISPTKAQHVLSDLGDDVAAVLDGGSCSVGLESTILDLSGPQPRLLRPGAVSREALEKELGQEITCSLEGAPRVPGTTATHYAPATPTRLVAKSRLASEVGSLQILKKTVAVLALGPCPAMLSGCAWRELPGNANAYARILYSSLRELDSLGCDNILIECPPESAEWVAVLDRLRRAAG